MELALRPGQTAECSAQKHALSTSFGTLHSMVLKSKPIAQGKLSRRRSRSFLAARRESP